MERIYRQPSRWMGSISSPITTMSLSKKQVKDKRFRLVINLESIFRLLMIGQQRQMEIEPLFVYELRAESPSLRDEHRCLRKGNKSDLVKRLGVPETLPCTAETIMFHSHFTILCGHMVEVLLV